MPLGERRHRSLLVLAAGLALGGGLAACTNGEGAEPDPTEDPTSIAPTGDPSGEPTAQRPEVEKPVPPDAMARDDVAGAEAAAQYFLELYRSAYATGDLDAWSAMSHEECIFCADVADDVTTLFQSGGHVLGGNFTVDHVTGRDPVEGNDFYRVDLLVTEEPSVRVEGDGERKEVSGGETLLIFAMGRVDDEWSVREVQIEEPDFDG